LDGQTGNDKLLITRVVSHRAKVAELADAPDLGSGPARGGGSSPPFRTKHLLKLIQLKGHINRVRNPPEEPAGPQLLELNANPWLDWVKTA
jgi:hypothetical protein